MKFSTKQLRLLLLGLLGVGIVVFIATTALGLNSLSRKSSQLVDLRLRGKALDAQLISLGAAKKQVEQYSYFNDVAKTVLPIDKDQAKAVFTISKFARESGFALGSITFPTSNLGLSGSASATGSSSAISQAKPVADIKGLYSLQLTITPDTSPLVPGNKVATYPKLIDFLKRIERDRRTAQITQIVIQQRNESSLPPQSINFTLIINIFMRPE
ncbi:MAG TPA: hypothetical protein VI336_01470 [Candidatus Saccharimonadales bacterium]|nr:hypothetical protein [Candidatus Saccharimonadales bacterium]